LQIRLPRQAMRSQGREHLSRFLQPAHEGHHDLEVRQAHLLTHAQQRLAFQREGLTVGRVHVARRTPQAQHRVLLGRLEVAAAGQRGVLAALEV
jgi:hypothetical protein